MVGISHSRNWYIASSAGPVRRALLTDAFMRPGNQAWGESRKSRFGIPQQIPVDDSITNELPTRGLRPLDPYDVKRSDSG